MARPPTQPNRDAILRSIEDLETTIAEFRSNSAVPVTPVLLNRLEDPYAAANAVGDAKLVAMLERLHRRVTTGRGFDG